MIERAGGRPTLRRSLIQSLENRTSILWLDGVGMDRRKNAGNLRAKSPLPGRIATQKAQQPLSFQRGHSQAVLHIREQAGQRGGRQQAGNLLLSSTIIRLKQRLGLGNMVQ